jgi:hypothetical protein
MATFSEDEWQRARDRLISLADDRALLDAFDRARAAGMIDAIFLRLLYAHGLSLRDLFGTPLARAASGGASRVLLAAYRCPSKLCGVARSIAPVSPTSA